MDTSGVTSRVTSGVRCAARQRPAAYRSLVGSSGATRATGATRASGAVAAALTPIVAIVVVVVASLVAASLIGPAARADEPVVQHEKTEAKRPSVDSASVYFGRSTNFSKPAEADADAVYAEIPEYKKILEDDIECGCARYELLMNKASRRFKAALRKVARDGGYDLIARTGSVRNVDDVPDVTQAVIDQL